MSVGAEQARLRIAGATDWAALWRNLVLARARCLDDGSAVDPSSSRCIDPWESRARDYDERVARRWTQPDSTRQFVLAQITDGATLLDIGAGTGAWVWVWAAMVAPHAARVTAVEPSPAMIRVLEQNLAVRGITNVSVVQGSWPEVTVDPHDFSLCAHAMYWSTDLPGFVGRMIACTRRMCFLVLRAPSLQGIMAEAALHLWGQSIDGPNLTVADNVLRQMGLCPHVLMERGGMREPRQSASFEDALQRMKRHFGVCDTTEHDEYFGVVLRRRLGYEGGRYIWPPGDGSALIYWTVE
jgi:SAM-dependent methyltransferase